MQNQLFYFVAGTDLACQLFYPDSNLFLVITELYLNGRGGGI
jgi:hypothetical protein